MAEKEQAKEKILMVSSSPHLVEPATSKRIMYEVVLGCLLPVIAALILFRIPAAKVLIASLAGCLGTEWIFNAVRKKRQTLGDGSAVVTAVILGLSLPPQFPWWAAVLGSVVAIGVAKMLFGGLGGNIFNPAMVGRAFLMACFGTMMTTWSEPVTVNAVTEPTPLALAKQPIKDAANPDKPEEQRLIASAVNQKIKDMFVGQTSGSLGETSALCWLIGGIFLLIRKTITWHIPLSVLGSAAGIGLIAWWIDPVVYANPLVHLYGGGLMMCAFFIATDPVSCPLTKQGRVIFGIGVGGLIMLIRLKGGYPEGVMYAVLLMNSMTPLLDRWTRPTPLGGHVSVD